MKNIKISIQYSGKNYFGMQIQPNKPTIQGEIEKALKELFKTNVKLFYAGRTDALVNAYNMVCNFFVDTDIPANKIAYALNYLLPDDIKVLNSQEVNGNFNARYSAKEKTYVYKFYTNFCELPLFLNEVCVKQKIDLNKMKKCAKFMLGKHDFSSFTSSECDKEDKIREIKKIKIKTKEIDNIMHYEVFITGNGFLYNMVRIMVGTLITFNKKEYSPKIIKEIINSKDRTKAGKTMQPEGLSLLNVKY